MGCWPNIYQKQILISTPFINTLFIDHFQDMGRAILYYDVLKENMAPRQLKTPTGIFDMVYRLFLKKAKKRSCQEYQLIVMSAIQNIVLSAMETIKSTI